MDPVSLAAHGESLWHRLGLAALGVSWVEEDGVARRTQPSTPVFLAALSLRAGVPAAALAGAAAGLGTELAVRDAGGSEDLGPFGFVLQAREPWMLRPPAPSGPGPAVAGLEVAPCRAPAEVELFERTSVEAFTGSTAGWSPGTIHPPEASLRVPGLTLLLARLHGDPIGTAIAATDGAVLNIAGVAVVEAARGQGVGTHLTLACLAAAPTLPAVLSSSADGHPLYRGLGFTDAGSSALWWRPGPRAS
ncbi:MAG TPA: GNAT family N-acetyltransferase [Actinomycetota bacterium]|nr:GNAT family N-acetyltransferase [Actinomycetota bacterium]